MDYEKIFKEAQDLENNSEKASEKVEDLTNNEIEKTEKDAPKEPKDQWVTAKNNVEQMEREFAALMRNPAVERVSKIDSVIMGSLKGLGTTMVGLSSIFGGLLKLGNTFIPGFGLISVPMSYILGGGRVIGQAMLDKSKPLQPISRTAPSGERYEKPKLVPTKKMDFRKTPQ
jgi:hypothetical protein